MVRASQNCELASLLSDFREISVYNRHACWPMTQARFMPDFVRTILLFMSLTQLCEAESDFYIIRRDEIKNSWQTSTGHWRMTRGGICCVPAEALPELLLTVHTFTSKQTHNQRFSLPNHIVEHDVFYLLEEGCSCYSVQGWQTQEGLPFEERVRCVFEERSVLEDTPLLHPSLPTIFKCYGHTSSRSEESFTNVPKMPFILQGLRQDAFVPGNVSERPQ